MSREERQRAQVVAAWERGHVARAFVLASEHVVEFPDDAVVRDIAARAARLLRLPSRDA